MSTAKRLALESLGLTDQSTPAEVNAAISSWIGEQTAHLTGEPVDLVNEPPHYKAGGMEAIDVIEAFAPDNYHRASALKYLLRAGRKDDTVQDLEKAVWYIRREIDTLLDALEEELKEP